MEKQLAFLIFMYYSFFMKWLIIFRRKEELHNVSSFISCCFPDSTIYIAESKSAAFQNVYSVLNDISHAVVFAAEHEVNPLLHFVLGYISGKNLPVYAIGQNDIESAVEHKFIKPFSDERQLLAYLKKNASEIIRDYTVRSAREILNEKGVPLTAENFANAIIAGDKELCRNFYEAGMDVNVRDLNGTPLLNVACRAEQFDMVTWLLARDADINAVSTDRGYTALMDAVWKGSEELTEFLTENGADVNTVNKEGQTNLVLAVGASRTNICCILAEHGADPDVKDAMGMSAYEYAKLFKKEAILKVLEPYHKEDAAE